MRCIRPTSVWIVGAHQTATGVRCIWPPSLGLLAPIWLPQGLGASGHPHLDCWRSSDRHCDEVYPATLTWIVDAHQTATGVRCIWPPSLGLLAPIWLPQGLGASGHPHLDCWRSSDRHCDEVYPANLTVNVGAHRTETGFRCIRPPSLGLLALTGLPQGLGASGHPHLDCWRSSDRHCDEVYPATLTWIVDAHRTDTVMRCIRPPSLGLLMLIRLTQGLVEIKHPHCGLLALIRLRHGLGESGLPHCGLLMLIRLTQGLVEIKHPHCGLLALIRLRHGLDVSGLPHCGLLSLIRLRHGLDVSGLPHCGLLMLIRLTQGLVEINHPHCGLLALIRLRHGLDVSGLPHCGLLMLIRLTQGLDVSGLPHCGLLMLIRLTQGLVEINHPHCGLLALIRLRHGLDVSGLPHCGLLSLIGLTLGQGECGHPHCGVLVLIGLRHGLGASGHPHFLGRPPYWKHWCLFVLLYVIDQEPTSKTAIY